MAAACGRKLSIVDLPHDVLCHVVRACDQRARTRCLLACKPLMHAVDEPGVWTSVEFSDLDDTAVAFMERHRCPDVVIRTETPDDVSHFFNQMADGGNDECIRQLSVFVTKAQRVPADLLAAISRMRRLRSLSLHFDELRGLSEVPVPPGLPMRELEDLSITETAEDDCKQLAVWFHGGHDRFPALKNLVVDVSLSDVVDNLASMPQLRVVRYRYDEFESDETYEHAKFDGLQLEELELVMTSDIDMEHLAQQLRGCSVRKLVLEVSCEDLVFRNAMCKGLEELHFKLNATHVHLHVDFADVKDAGLRLIAVQPGEWIADMDLNPCLMFERTPSINDWLALCNSLTLRLHEATRILVSPV